jgi:hypothetical protein
MIKFLSVTATTFASMVVALGALVQFVVGCPLTEGEFNGSTLLMVGRAVHACLDGWPVN